jgi:hypothetical protein
VSINKAADNDWFLLSSDPAGIKYVGVVIVVVIVDRIMANHIRIDGVESAGTSTITSSMSSN